MGLEPLKCDILDTLVRNHSHHDSSMTRSDVVRRVTGKHDADVVRDALNELVEEFDFLSEHGRHRKSRIHLDQSTGEFLDVLAHKCDIDVRWYKSHIGSHTPNEKLMEHGINPNNRFG